MENKMENEIEEEIIEEEIIQEIYDEEQGIENRPRHDSLVVDDTMDNGHRILETDQLLDNLSNDRRYNEDVSYVDMFEQTVHKIYDNVTYILSYVVDMTVYGYFYLKNKIVRENNHQYARVPQGIVNEL